MKIENDDNLLNEFDSQTSSFLSLFPFQVKPVIVKAEGKSVLNSTYSIQSTKTDRNNPLLPFTIQHKYILVAEKEKGFIYLFIYYFYFYFIFRFNFNMFSYPKSGEIFSICKFNSIHVLFSGLLIFLFKFLLFLNYVKKELLQLVNIPCLALHAKMQQKQRLKNLERLFFYKFFFIE
jgi:hypothetical protein